MRNKNRRERETKIFLAELVLGEEEEGYRHTHTGHDDSWKAKRKDALLAI
jgi:hypothetical protein